MSRSNRFPLPPCSCRDLLPDTLCAILGLFLFVSFTGFFGAIPLKANAHDAEITPGLEKLHRATLQALRESQENNPVLFDLIQQRNATAAQNFLNDPLEDLDLSRIVGRPYSDYDSRAWAMPSVAFALFNAGLCYVQPDNRWYRSEALLAKSEAGFEWILRHVTPEGTLAAPDGNIDRFTYAPAWEAFILLAPDLTAPLRERFSRHLLNAAEYQVRFYGKKEGSPVGRYPNMDTAYVLIMQQAASLFDRGDFATDADMLLDRLADCLSGSTWLYMRTDTAKWNPTPGYTQIALQYLGRIWQLGGNPKALRQIQLHADYYRHYVEPGGQMDYGSTPHIKHDWTAPYTDSVLGVELVRRYATAPDLVLQSIADRAHEALRRPIKGLHTRWMIYWLAADAGQRETLPMNFVREAPEINGFQARATNESGTLSVYATGRESACDTRLSAISSGANGEQNSDAALTGVFVEYIRNGVSYFMGEMQPRISTSVEPDKRTATLIATQNRRSMGPEAKPLMSGNFMGNIKKWTQDCWRGGSPIVNPITNTETWRWSGDQLHGTISVTALRDATFDEIRITLPFLHQRIDEQKTSPGYAAARSGNLCVEIIQTEGSWTSPLQGETNGQLVFVSQAPADGILRAGTTLAVNISIRLGTSLQTSAP